METAHTATIHEHATPVDMLVVAVVVVYPLQVTVSSMQLACWLMALEMLHVRWQVGSHQ